jgi:hypothetical protein
VRSDSTPTADVPVRRWAAVASTVLGVIADQPRLWLPGALAWLATVGWIPLVVGVVQPPTAGELTFLGPRFYTSGLWPLNVMLLGASVVAVAALLLLLAALGNAVLLATAERRRPSGRDVLILLVSYLVACVPVAFAMLTLAVALIAIGPAEFNRPQADPGPVVRTAGRLAPLLVFAVVVVVAASTFAGLAGRGAARTGSLAAGMTGVPRLLRRAWRPGIVHLAVMVGLTVVYLVLVTILLRVLWAPIAALVEVGAVIDLATILLLVGFVAIWLCLVLGGGAVHAWGSMTATLLLGGGTTGAASDRPQETQIDR